MMKLAAIDHWNDYLWMWRGWDDKGNPATINPLPEGAVVESTHKHITSYHPWSNVVNAVVGNDAFFAFLHEKGIRFHFYKDHYDGDPVMRQAWSCKGKGNEMTNTTQTYTLGAIKRLANLSGREIAAAYATSGEDTDYDCNVQAIFVHFYVNSEGKLTAVYEVEGRGFEGQAFITINAQGQYEGSF